MYPITRDDSGTPIILSYDLQLLTLAGLFGLADACRAGIEVGGSPGVGSGKMLSRV